MEEWFLIASNFPICFSIHIYLFFKYITFLKSFFFFFFYCGPFLWFLLNLLQYCLFCVLVFWPQGLWHLSSPARDRTCTPYIGRWILNHWTTREVPIRYLRAIKKMLNFKKQKLWEPAKCRVLDDYYCDSFYHCAVDEWFTKLTFRLTKLRISSTPFLHRELRSGLSDDLQGWWVVEGRLKTEGIYVYI